MEYDEVTCVKNEHKDEFEQFIRISEHLKTKESGQFNIPVNVGLRNDVRLIANYLIFLPEKTDSEFIFVTDSENYYEDLRDTIYQHPAYMNITSVRERVDDIFRMFDEYPNFGLYIMDTSVKWANYSSFIWTTNSYQQEVFSEKSFSQRYQIQFTSYANNNS